MRVQVSRVDLDGRKIDFRLVREGEELLNRAMKDKGNTRESGDRGAGRAAPDSVPFKASGKRAARKMSEPLARAPKSASHPMKAAAKNKDKGHKSRRRS